MIFTDLIEKKQPPESFFMLNSVHPKTPTFGFKPSAFGTQRSAKVKNSISWLIPPRRD
jgi:hypothetical protein